MAETQDPRQAADPKLKQFNDKMTSLVDAAMQVTHDWLQLWTDGWNYLFANQLEGKERSQGWQKIQANQLWPAAMQEVSLMSQRKPKIVAQPVEDTDSETAETWNGMLQFAFMHTLKMPRKLMEASMDGKVYGYYVGKTIWNDKAEWDSQREQWIGQAELSIMRPDFVGSDPEGEEFGDNYFVLQRRISLADAKAQWPEFVEVLDKVAVEGVQNERDRQGAVTFYVTRDNETGSAIRTDAEEGRLVRLLRKDRRPERPNAVGEQKPTHVTIEEIWLRDGSTKRVTEREAIPVAELFEEGLVSMAGSLVINNATGELMTEEDFPRRDGRTFSKPMFPNGRFVQRAGKTILNPDETDQVWPYRNKSTTIGVNVMAPHTWQGVNAVEMSRQLQDWQNVGLAHILNYVRQYGDPVVMIEQGALQEDKQNRNVASKLKSRAGAVWKLAKGAIGRGAIARVPPPPMSRGLLEFFNLIGQQIRDQTGIQQVAMGKQSKGATATEILRLETNSRLRVSMQSSLMDQFIIRVMETVAELMQENMEVGDIVRIVGPKGERSAVEITEKIKTARFDIALEVGTALPFDDERIKQDYLTAAEAIASPGGQIMAPEILKAFDIPNADVILERMDTFQRVEQEIEKEKLKAEVQQDFERAKAQAEADKAGEGGEAGDEAVNLEEAIAADAAGAGAVALK